MIELVLVMVLLTVVISISAPSLGRFFKGRTLDSEARRMVSLARYARSRAVSEGVPMLFWIDPQKAEYGLNGQQAFMPGADAKSVSYTMDDDLSVQVTSAPVVTRSTSLGQDNPFGRNVFTIRFQPDGFVAEGSPQTITLADKSGSTIWIGQTTNRVSYEILDGNPSTRAR